MTVEEILSEYAEYFTKSDIFQYFLRLIGWGLIKVAKALCDAAQSLWESVFDMITFMQSGRLDTLLSEYFPVFFCVLMLAFLALALTYILTDKRPDVIRNLLITISCVFLLPRILGDAIQLLDIQKNVSISSATVSEQTISANVTDLLYLSENGWDFDLPIRNNIPSAWMGYIDYNATVDPSSVSDELFGKYIVGMMEDGTPVTFRFAQKGWFDIFDPPWYYRYNIKFGTIIFGLFVDALILIFASYRLFRIIWEMFVGRILAVIFSGDFVSGKSVKQVLHYMLNCFVAVSVMLLGFRIFTMFKAYISVSVSSGFVRIFLTFFAGMAMVDGPDLVERLLGIDIGASQGYLKFMAGSRLAGAAGRTAASGVSFLSRTVRNAGKKNQEPGKDGQKSQSNRFHSSTGIQKEPGGDRKKEADEGTRTRENVSRTPTDGMEATGRKTASERDGNTSGTGKKSGAEGYGAEPPSGRRKRGSSADPISGVDPKNPEPEKGKATAAPAETERTVRGRQEEPFSAGDSVEENSNPQSSVGSGQGKSDMDQERDGNTSGTGKKSGAEGYGAELPSGKRKKGSSADPISGVDPKNPEPEKGKAAAAPAETERTVRGRQEELFSAGNSVEGNNNPQSSVGSGQGKSDMDQKPGGKQVMDLGKKPERTMQQEDSLKKQVYIEGGKQPELGFVKDRLTEREKGPAKEEKKPVAPGGNRKGKGSRKWRKNQKGEV